MKTRMLLVLAAVLLCGFVTLPPVFAQSINGSISGVVSDERGDAVAGATVTVSNVDTGATRNDATNDEGLYRISGLPVGFYSVKVEHSGFGGSEERTNVSSGTDTTVNFKLGAGPIKAQVEVSDSGALLETTQSQVSKTVDQRRILELPGRNSLNGLALLNPGVLPNQNSRPGSGFAVNGNRTRSNNFTIDGANNNDQSLSIPRQGLPPEALGEFQIITNTFAAEYGRNAGSYVNQITRSGTNDFHGTGFYNWDGNGVDALTTTQQRCVNSNTAANPNNLSQKQILRNCRSVSNDSIYGVTFGGPIVRNHTFFFTSFDFQDFRQTVSSASRLALSPASRTFLQNNAALFAPGTADFLLNNFPVSNDPTSGGSLAVRNLNVAGNPQIGTLSFLTFNRGATGGIPYKEDFDRELIKINTKINNNDQLSFRFLRDNFKGPFAGTGITSLPGQEVGQNIYDRSFTVNDAYILTAKMINESRFTYSQRQLSFPENLGFAFAITGTGTAFTLGNANFPQSRNDKVLELTDNLSYTTGNHALKFGYNMLRYHLASFFAPNLRGTVSYGDINNFLFDRNASFQQYAGDGLTDAVTYEHSWFAQDDWRVNPDLTLNLGLRYEYVTTPFGFFSNAKSDVNNFGPRVGLAWNPKGFLDGKMVFRAGFGVAYDQVFQNILLNNSRNFPRGVNVSFTNITGQHPFNNLPAPPTPQTFVAQGGNPLLLPERLFSPNERIKQPRSDKWTVGFQYQLANDYVIKAEYIGTRGSNLVREVEANVGFTAASGLGNGQRRDPTRGSILIGQGIAKSIYHSGQFTIEKRFAALNFFDTNFGSSTFNANYTWSSFISESDDVLGGQANRTLPGDPRCPECDRGRSGFDQPHRFVMSSVWVSPEVFRSHSFLNRVFSGWELAGVTTLASGTPYTVFSGNNALGILAGQVSTVEGSQRVSVNPAGIYPLVSTPTAPVANAYFIVNAANSGIVGSLGSNTQRTGGTQNSNLSVVKNIRTVGETQRLQLRMEVFDLFNHRNFTIIPSNTAGNTINATTFLNLGQTNVVGRTFLFGARYFF
jgi:Carboxypeptidase regulatory-like domain/TonB dependent receptor/TonB-dependent Receptor Plug Domain